VPFRKITDASLEENSCPFAKSPHIARGEFVPFCKITAHRSRRIRALSQNHRRIARGEFVPFCKITAHRSRRIRALLQNHRTSLEENSCPFAKSPHIARGEGARLGLSPARGNQSPDAFCERARLHSWIVFAKGHDFSRAVMMPPQFYSGASAPEGGEAWGPSFDPTLPTRRDTLPEPAPAPRARGSAEYTRSARNSLRRPR